MKARFLLGFLLTFAILIPLGVATDFPHVYARSLEVSGSVLSPALSGWSFERSAAAGPSGLRFRRGSESLPFQLSLDALALGLLPLLSLIGATPGMGAGRRAAAVAIGVAGLFALDLAILIAYPWMVRNPNWFKDITGTFLGLLTFVGGPVILWFALTYRNLRDVWKFEQSRDQAPGTSDQGR
jgi:hypothetical protein